MPNHPPGTPVFYDTGDEKAFGLVVRDHGNNVVDLIYFPSTSPVEHQSSVPQGEGGVTWQPA